MGSLQTCHHRVLVVDDNDLVRRMIREIVSNKGWEVCGEARNGQEAVLMLPQCHPDLVILDYKMPVKDGLQTAREILQIQPALPIVLNTLYFTDQLNTAAKLVGVRQIVSKSDTRSLIEAMEFLLQVRQKRSAPST